MRTDNVEIARLLLEHGANVNARDLAGKTAFDYARSTAMRNFLQQYAVAVMRPPG